jgi:hypothetical protein
MKEERKLPIATLFGHNHQRKPFPVQFLNQDETKPFQQFRFNP